MLEFLINVLCVGAGNVHVVPHHQLGGEAGAKDLQVRHVRKGKSNYSLQIHIADNSVAHP